MSPRSLFLNFHGVGPVPRSLSNGELDCWLDTEHFERILDAVCKYPHVKLTFDDGNTSDVDVVLPALLRRGMTASFFVCSGRLDAPTFLSREQVGLLRAKGMQVGSHGVAHRSWRLLDNIELTSELRDSRVALEEICGVMVREAACPFGQYDAGVLRELRRTGYERIYTSDGGYAPCGSWIQSRNTITRKIGMEKVLELVQRPPGIFRSTALRFKQFIKGIRK